MSMQLQQAEQHGDDRDEKEKEIKNDWKYEKETRKTKLKRERRMSSTRVKRKIRDDK